MKPSRRARARTTTTSAAALAVVLAFTTAAGPAWADGETPAAPLIEETIDIAAQASDPAPEAPPVPAAPTPDVVSDAAPTEAPADEAPAAEVAGPEQAPAPEPAPVVEAPAVSEPAPVIAAAAAALPLAIAFTDSSVGPGERATVYFNGDVTMTSFSGDMGCQLLLVDGMLLGGGTSSFYEFDASFEDLTTQAQIPRGSEITYVVAADDEQGCESYEPGTPSWASVLTATTTLSLPAAGEPSLTNWAMMCNGGDGPSLDYATNPVRWDDVCLTTGEIEDASTATKSDAFDGFGTLTLSDPASGWQYVVAADTSSDHSAAPGQVRFVDRGVQIPGRDGTVDLAVRLSLVGSWATWSVTAVESGTSIPAVIDMALTGNLGSDSNTEWTAFAGGLVSTDGTSGYDPALIHIPTVTGGTGAFQNSDDDVRYAVTGSGFSYSLGLLEYCGSVDRVAAAVAIGTSFAQHRGTELAPLVGTDCRAASAPVVNATVGEPLDVTVPFTLKGDWDLGNGVDVSLSWDSLPAGVSYEIIDSGVAGVVPSIRFFGTPTETGLFSLSLNLSFDNGSSWTTVTVQVLPVAVGVTAGPVSITQGTAGATTVPLALTGPWDLSDGAALEVTGLPEGVRAEITGAQVPGSKPTLRLVGTPVVAGSYTATVTLVAGNRHAEADVAITVTPMAQPLRIDLGIDPGDLVAGAPVSIFGAGLSVGSPWSVTVRSTPQVIASGVVGASGSFGVTALMPSNLEAGWHSITADAVLASAAAASRVLWFEIGADGTLLRVASEAPSSGPAAAPGAPLPVTGADATPAVWLGGALLAFGAVLTLWGAVRRRNA